MSVTIYKPDRASGVKLDKVSDRLTKAMRSHGAADPIPPPKTVYTVAARIAPKIRKATP